MELRREELFKCPNCERMTPIEHGLAGSDGSLVCDECYYDYHYHIIEEG